MLSRTGSIETVLNFITGSNGTPTNKNTTTKVLLIGGCGYVGIHVALALLESSMIELGILDTADLPVQLHPSRQRGRIIYAQESVKDRSRVSSFIGSFKPVLVIHLASWGMSGSGMLQRECYDVNVDALGHVIDACKAFNVHRLIYTSTYNVIYGGSDIVNGDEKMPYYPQDGHTDQYSASKSVAEQLVLNANGTDLADGSKLLTSAIRPAAIYGEGEMRHFPRIVENIDRGLFTFQIGSATVDWVHISNLTQAYVLLINELMSSTKPTTSPAGNAYFISDGTPINNFEFLRPVVEARKRVFPQLVLPTPLMVHVAWVMELVFYITNACYIPVEPMLTRAEVYKVGVTHYFSIEKAKKDLGYRPTFTSEEGSKQMGKYYAYSADTRDSFNNNFIQYNPLYISVTVVSAMVALGLSAHGCDFTTLPQPLKFALLLNDEIALTLFRSRFALKVVFYLASLAHVGEGVYAYFKARAIGCRNTSAIWFIQVLLLGYFSMRYLLERASQTDVGIQTFSEDVKADATNMSPATPGKKGKKD
jgi:nucleoside-diphosphate-sugar epimerase